MIYRIARGTVAARLGLAPGDVILAVNGQTLASVNDLRRALEAANGSWDITFRRNGQTRTLRID